jgi:hypothetical protein
MMSLEALKKYGVQIDSFSYRGIDVGFYEDTSGHQITAIWEDNLFQFGVYNTSYRDDMKIIIDDHLDTITRFEEQPAFYGSKLEYFDNAGFRDVRLIYRGRVLGVWANVSDSTMRVIEEAAVELILNEIRRRNSQNN